MIRLKTNEGDVINIPDDTPPDQFDKYTKRFQQFKSKRQKTAPTETINPELGVPSKPGVTPEEQPTLKQGYSPLHEKLSNIKHYAKEAAPHVGAMLNPWTFAADIAQQTGRSVYEAPPGKKMEALWDALAQTLFGPAVPGGPPTFMPGVIAPGMRARIPKEAAPTEPHPPPPPESEMSKRGEMPQFKPSKFEPPEGKIGAKKTIKDLVKKQPPKVQTEGFKSGEIVYNKFNGEKLEILSGPTGKGQFIARKPDGREGIFPTESLIKKPQLPVETKPPIPEAPEEPAIPTKGRKQTQVVAIGKNKDIIGQIQEDVKAGFAGGKNYLEKPESMDKDVIGFPSTFPEYFQNKNFTKKDVLTVLDKASKGKALSTEIQAKTGMSQVDILNTLIEGKRKELAGRAKSIRGEQTAPKPVTAVDLNPGDQFKIAGEQYQMAGHDPETHDIILKDGETKIVDPFDQIPVDYGSMKKAKGGEVPATQQPTKIDRPFPRVEDYQPGGKYAGAESPTPPGMYKHSSGVISSEPEQLSPELQAELHDYISKTGGFLSEKQATQFKEKYGNITVVVKDVNGQRARFNLDDFMRLTQNKAFSDRIRSVFIPPGAVGRGLGFPPDIDPEFMRGIQPEKLLSEKSETKELPNKQEVIKDLEGIKLSNKSTISLSQQQKFVDMLSNEKIRGILKELGIKEVNILPPYRFELSEQAHLIKGKKIININADATDPSQTILHELGHAKFESLPREERSKLIEQAKNTTDPKMQGYKGLEAWEEIIADTMYQDILKKEPPAVPGPKQPEMFKTDIPMAKIPTEQGFGEAGEKGTLFEEGGPGASAKAEKEMAEKQIPLIPGQSSVGAAASGSKETPLHLDQLRQTIEKNTNQNTPTEDRVKLGQAIAEKYSDVKDSAGAKLNTIKGVTGALYSALRRPPLDTEWKKILGNYLRERTVYQWSARQFAKVINKKYPKLKQDAITNYIEAEGNLDRLQERVGGSTKRELRRGYEEATRLTEEEKLFAENARQFFDAGLDEAIQAGVLDHGIENYVRHSYKDRDATKILASPEMKRLNAEINSGLLKTNPSFAKKRIHQTFYDAEQAGRIPEKRIGFQIVAWANSFYEAIAARKMIRGMFKGKASDGRPLVTLSGSGRMVEGPEGDVSYLIRPRTKPTIKKKTHDYDLDGNEVEELNKIPTQDYQVIDHPALRKWKWVGKDLEGNPIYLQSDALVHPEVYTHLKNMLATSKIRNWEIMGIKPGKKALDYSRGFKNTLLSLSGFHQTQEGLHGVFHNVNPANLPPVDLTNPLVLGGVERGLMIIDNNALSEFSEGVHSSGLVNKLPVLGKYLQKYNDYLFQDYIPRLKVKMYLEALKRNKERYSGKYSNNQIFEITANQANAAFGELNYKWLGRSPTVQDFFRLMALAPDFLEARLRFVGQAVKPGGREQAMALIRGASYLYFGGIIGNMILNDGNPYLDRPFSLVINGREYTLRSIPGDIAHLVRDPRSFVYHRLNPMISRSLVEYLSGVDSFGRKRDVGKQIKDLFQDMAPIPTKGLVTDQEISFLDGLLTSIGVSSYKYKSPAERALSEDLIKKLPPSAFTDEAVKSRKEKNEIIKKLRSGDSLSEASQGTELTKSQLHRLKKTAKRSNLENQIINASIPAAIRAWDQANDEEKKTIKPLLKKKIQHSRSIPRRQKNEYLDHLKQ